MTVDTEETDTKVANIVVKVATAENADNRPQEGTDLWGGTGHWTIGQRLMRVILGQALGGWGISGIVAK